MHRSLASPEVSGSPVASPATTRTPTRTTARMTAGQVPRPAAPADPALLSIRRSGRTLLTATVQPVDAPGGVLDPPAGIVGWYAATGWPRPGESSRQHAVLAGHVRWDGRPGVFARLGEIRVGDSVLVTDARGRALEFVVDRGPTVLDKSEIAAGPNGWIWSSTHPVRRLTLITCDANSPLRPDGHVTDNLVVQARGR